MQKITEITWNWSPACMESNGDRIDCYSDTCEKADMSDPRVVSIEEHRSMGEGDKFYYDIKYRDGTFKRIFNPNTVEFYIV